MFLPDPAADTAGSPTIGPASQLNWANGTHSATISQIKGPTGGSNDGPNCLIFRDREITHIENASFVAAWTNDVFTELTLSFGDRGDNVEVTGESPLSIEIESRDVVDGFSLSIQPPNRLGVINDIEFTLDWTFQHDDWQNVEADEAGGC